MTAAKARVLEAVPIGIRQDGKLVAACCDPLRKGLRQALQNIFMKDVSIAAATPSSDYKLIDRWESENKNAAADGAAGSASDKPAPKLTEEEISDFNLSYKAGKFVLKIFIKAAGFVGEAVLLHAPDDMLLRWLENSGYLESEASHLLAALQSAAEGMDRHRRRDLLPPSTLEILQRANYITDESVLRIKERIRGEEGLDDMIKTDFIASDETIRKIRFLLFVLNRINSQENI
jgi:hypothetical protein